MKKDTKCILKIVYQKIIEENYTIETIEDLCSLIGISKKTFYKDHPSKEQFILNLLSHLNTEITTEINKLLDDEDEIVIKIIKTIQILLLKSYKKNVIIESYGKQNQLIEFLDEEFEIAFTNVIIKLLDQMNDNDFLNSKANLYIFSEVLVKFSLDVMKHNHKKHNETNTNFLLKHLLVNALKGICEVSQHKIIANYIEKLDFK